MRPRDSPAAPRIPFAPSVQRGPKATMLPGRLELPTLRLTASCSNQMRYGSLGCSWRRVSGSARPRHPATENDDGRRCSRVRVVFGRCCPSLLTLVDLGDFFGPGRPGALLTFQACWGLPFGRARDASNDNPAEVHSSRLGRPGRGGRPPPERGSKVQFVRGARCEPFPVVTCLLLGGFQGTPRVPGPAAIPLPFCRQRRRGDETRVETQFSRHLMLASHSPRSERAFKAWLGPRPRRSLALRSSRDSSLGIASR
jgi:hypothetical protein